MSAGLLSGFPSLLSKFFCIPYWVSQNLPQICTASAKYICGIHKQMQYRFAVNFGTLSMKTKENRLYGERVVLARWLKFPEPDKNSICLAQFQIHLLLISFLLKRRLVIFLSFFCHVCAYTLENMAIDKNVSRKMIF